MAHKHSVYDTDNHFMIDGVTRAVKNVSQTKTMLVQHDHNSERFTFELPRHIDGHDMSACDAVQVHYINIDSATAKAENPLFYSGVYEVDDLQISPDDDDVVICSWLISGNATRYVGNLVFIVRFSCTSEDGTIDYAWNTAKHSNVFVTEGIYNGYAVAYEYADILAQWKQELIDAGVDALTLDKTLLVEGEAADAKAAGDAIRTVYGQLNPKVEAVRAQISDIESDLYSVTTSDNRFDNLYDEAGSIDVSTGSPVDTSTFKRSSKFYALGNDFAGTIYLSQVGLTTSLGVLWYDEGKGYLGYTMVTSAAAISTKVLPAAQYFRVYAHKDFSGSVYVSPVQPESYETVEYAYFVNRSLKGVEEITAEVQDIRTAYDGTVYDTAGEAVRAQICALNDVLQSGASVNLFDASKQTEDTIDPHYYVNGAPHTTTQFDSQWNCTAPIDILPETQYSLGLVPAVAGNTAPWFAAAMGVMFYDASGAYISTTANTTFVTPANAASMRFNYRVGANYGLAMLHTNCMLVYGDTLPGEYEAYAPPGNKLNILEERVKEIEASIKCKPIYFAVSGTKLVTVAKYSAEKDIVVELDVGGGNGLFDFRKIGFISNANDEISTNISSRVNVLDTTSDHHAPWIIYAVDNINGDDLNGGTFTGGSHGYNNTASGSTATARMENLRFFIDGMECTDKTGYARTIEIRWTNYIQATNTKKVDGTGREVLRENHRLTFDGVRWESHVEVIPLENVSVTTWYGLQGVISPFNTVRFVGDVNRTPFAIANGSCESGGISVHEIICSNDDDTMIIGVDNNYDLGDRHYANKSTKGMFTGGIKCYCSIISAGSTDNTPTLVANGLYCLRGYYRFMPT